jgi:hypothetical protein
MPLDTKLRFLISPELGNQFILISTLVSPGPAKTPVALWGRDSFTWCAALAARRPRAIARIYTFRCSTGFLSNLYLKIKTMDFSSDVCRDLHPRPKEFIPHSPDDPTISSVFSAIQLT